MSFLNNMINEFTHKNQSQRQQEGYGGGYAPPPQGSYAGPGYPQAPPQGGYPPRPQGYNDQPYNSSYGNDRPNPPAPWIAEWDQRENRWIYINRETGQQTHEFPGGPGAGGYGYGGDSRQGGYGTPPPQQAEQHKSHTGRNTAIGVAAGLAGGALLMHEGHKVEERWDEDKYRMEERFDDAKYRAEDRIAYDADRVEDFPEDAARWTGRKVQEVEDIPEDVDRRWDDFKQDVEDVPQDIAYGVGDAVGDVERFGDRVDDAYDDGRDDARYDDDNDRRDDW